MDPITRLPISFGLVAAYSPNDLNNLLQYALDEGETYNMTQFAGDDAHYLKDLRTDLGTLRAPLQGYVLNFDGTDDYGTLGGRITTGGPTAISAFAWIKTSGTDETIFSEYDTLSQRCWLLQVMTSTGKLRMVLSNNGTSTYNLDSLEAVNDGEWHHVGFSYDGTSDAKIFIDGVDVTGNASSGGTFVTSLLDTSADFVIGALNSGGGSFFGGEIKDVRVYSSAKSEAQTQGIMAGTIDDTDILGHWWGNDKSGTVLRDRSGNGNHLTATNITESTFHLADPTVVNPANSEGYSQNYVGPNSYRDIEVIPAGSLPQTLVDVSCKVKNPNSDNKFAMFGSTGSSVALGLSESGSALLPNLNSGTITTKVDGVIVATRGDLHTAISDGSEHTVLFENVDFSASASWDGGLYVGGFNSAPWVLDGVQIWDITIDGVTYPVGDIIPAVDATTDALGNTLQYQGNAPFPIRADTPCITGDGTSVDVQIQGLSRPDEVEFFAYIKDNAFKYLYTYRTAATSTQLVQVQQYSATELRLQARSSVNALVEAIWTIPEVNRWYKIKGVMTYGASGVVNLYVDDALVATGSGDLSGTLSADDTVLLGNDNSAVFYDGRIADFRVTTGGVTTTFPLQEGEGRDLGWWATDGTKGVVSGAIVGGSLANIWANLCPGLVKDHSILYGGNTQRNIMRYSEDFSNTVWAFANSRITFTHNVLANPVDGTVNASLITEDNTSGEHRVFYYDNHTSNGSYGPESWVFSIHLKDNGVGKVRIFTDNTINTTIDLTNGTADRGNMEALANGWYRWSYQYTSPDAVLAPIIRLYRLDSVTYLGDGTSGVYIACAQTEPATADGLPTVYQATGSTYPVPGAFVPGDPNSANDVAGNPKTLPAGDFGNPHSRLQFNPFAVQEITAINGESDYVAGTFRHLVAPADTKYADTSTDGTSSTLISVSGALTGADKTNTETYVNIPAIPANMITIGGSTPITIDNTQYVVIGS